MANGLEDGPPGQLALRRADDVPSLIEGIWRPQSANEASRSVEVVFSSGADVLRQSMFGESYVERLRIDADSVDLSRLRTGAPVLDSHQRDGVRNVLGTVSDAWIEGDRGVARVRFSERAADVWNDVREGILRQVSIGYSRDAEVELDETINGVPVREVTRLTPYEISFVSIGADPHAQVRNHEVTTAVRTPQEEEPQMENNVLEIERARCAYIVENCERLGLPSEFRRELIDKGITRAEAAERILEHKASQPGQVEEIDHRIEPGDGKRAKSFAEDAAEGLLVRERIIPDTKSPRAREFVTASFCDIAERSLSLAGVDHRTIRDKPSLFKRAFITSTTLADTLATFSTRSLMSGYEASPRTFVDAFRESVSRNFKPNERIRVSDTPALAVVAEGDNFQEVTLSDRKESFTVGKYGHILKYTIEALVNDDLGAIGREAERAGFAAATTESDVFWSVITTNGNMSDSTPIFDAGEGNLVTGVALTADALEDAREYFRTVTTENSVKLNLVPRFLFVAPNLERTAEKLVSPPVNHSTATLTDVLSNAYAGSLELRVESRLPAGDWMLAVDYRSVDTLEFAWLEGRRGVFVEQDGDFDSMGIKFRVADMFGAGAIDRRGVYYNDAA